MTDEHEDQLDMYAIHTDDPDCVFLAEVSRNSAGQPEAIFADEMSAMASRLIPDDYYPDPPTMEDIQEDIKSGDFDEEFQRSECSNCNKCAR